MLDYLFQYGQGLLDLHFRGACKSMVGVGILLSFISCQPEDNQDQQQFGRFFMDQLLHQTATERLFLDVSYKEVFTLPSYGSDTLFQPGIVFVDDHGAIYVADHGIAKVYKYSPDGKYLMTFGYGLGDGPGQLFAMSEFGVISDSIVYLVNGPGRKISYYSFDDGAYLQSELYDDQIMRYTRTLTGRDYILSVNVPVLIETRLNKKKTPVVRYSDLTPNLGDNKNPGPWGTGGSIIAHQENLVFALERYPLVMQYEPDGTMLYARTTIDYSNDFVEPTLKTEIFGDLPIGQLSGPYYTTFPLTINDNKLYAHSLYPVGEAIDVYNVHTGEYIYSMRPPQRTSNRDIYAVYHDRVYQTRDTTVTVWHIEN